MTSLGERMLDFAIRGTKRAGSDLGSGPPSKKYHVTPVAPPKPARIRHAPQTVESSPVKSPPRPVSPAKAKSSKPSWYTKTAAMKEADSKNDLQIQVNGKAGELGKPTKFFRKNYVILSHPENLIQGKFQKKILFLIIIIIFSTCFRQTSPTSLCQHRKQRSYLRAQLARVRFRNRKRERWSDDVCRWT